MISYREQLAKIGFGPSDPVSFSSFFLAPNSLRETMRSMDFPSKFTEVVPGDELDQDWTEEIQGVAFAHGRWFFTQNDPDHKHLHVFDGPTGAQLKTWNLKAVPPAPLPGFQFNHFGHIQIEDGFIFIDHFWGNSGQILVMTGDGLTLDFSRWILLENVPEVGGRVGMIAVNSAARKIVTAGGKKNIKRVLLHDLDSGAFLDRRLFLDPPISDNCYAQGGFWSPNNHLFISSGQGGLLDTAKGHQFIYCYSPLNGKRLGLAAVTTESGRQELEGCCFAPMIRDGQAVQFHAVLLENEGGAKDDIFLKSFSADQPDLI